MNLLFPLKAVITIALVLVASVLARRTGWLGALVAAWPLTSLAAANATAVAGVTLAQRCLVRGHA